MVPLHKNSGLNHNLNLDDKSLDNQVQLKYF
jgi:hypothetical protein